MKSCTQGAAFHKVRENTVNLHSVRVESGEPPPGDLLEPLHLVLIPRDAAGMHEDGVMLGHGRRRELVCRPTDLVSALIVAALVAIELIGEAVVA